MVRARRGQYREQHDPHGGNYSMDAWWVSNEVLNGCLASVPRSPLSDLDDHLTTTSVRAPDGRTVVIYPSTADCPNRARDKIRVESQFRLPEIGDETTEFYMRTKGQPRFAVGYDRVVYGDHGPYAEFSDRHLVFEAFDGVDQKTYYDEWYTNDWYGIRLYAQKQTVEDRPNPPWGKWAVNNNRPGGYADYRVGKFYVLLDVEDISIVLHASRWDAQDTIVAIREQHAWQKEDDLWRWKEHGYRVAPSESVALQKAGTSAPVVVPPRSKGGGKGYPNNGKENGDAVSASLGRASGGGRARKSNGQQPRLRRGSAG